MRCVPWPSCALAEPRRGWRRRVSKVHGGIGYTWEHDLHLYVKRAKLDEALCGDAAWHARRAGRRLIADAAGVDHAVEELLG